MVLSLILFDKKEDLVPILSKSEKLKLEITTQRISTEAPPRVKVCSVSKFKTKL